MSTSHDSESLERQEMIAIHPKTPQKGMNNEEKRVPTLFPFAVTVLYIRQVIRTNFAKYKIKVKSFHSK